MQAKVVQIGNSRGIRIPRALLEQCGIGDTVELDVSDGTITLRAAPKARVGWDLAAREMSGRNEDSLIHESAPTEFDEAEWEW